jgi:hypothetical protein
MRRRDFLLKSLLSSAGLSLLPTFSLPLGRSRTATTPIRAITKGPKFHWFGYYDKYQFDASGRYVLGMAVDFESRSPTAEDKIEIGLIDLADRDKWTRLGESSAWGWQQGCMLQWVPGKTDEVIWNDCKDGQLVSRILNYRTGALRTLPKLFVLSQNRQRRKWDSI